MMGTLGIQEMIVIFVIALVLFGPKKLPELGRTIGKAITEFRRASNDLKASFEREMQTLERESQSISQVAQVTAGDIFNRAINYDPDHENRSLPPAETAWNPLEPQKVESESHESHASVRSPDLGFHIHRYRSIHRRRFRNSRRRIKWDYRRGRAITGTCSGHRRHCASLRVVSAQLEQSQRS